MNWVLFKTKKPKNGQLVYTYNLDKDIFNIGYYDNKYKCTIDYDDSMIDATHWSLPQTLEKDMKEQYVIKTRNDEEEYLAWNTRSEQFYFTNTVKFAEKINSVEDARKCTDIQVLKESKYKYDIYKIVQSLEYVERGV